MILYHYAVSSYKGDSSLTNDHDRNFDDCKPFLDALAQAEAAFLRELERQKQTYTASNGKQCGTYVKDAVEAIFEHVRRTEFEASSVSRVNCVYYCRSVQEAVELVYANVLSEGYHTPEECAILEVEVRADVFTYDQNWYDMAYERCETGSDTDMIRTLCAYARSYFSKQATQNPVWEHLCGGENRVIRRLTGWVKPQS